MRAVGWGLLFLVAVVPATAGAQATITKISDLPPGSLGIRTWGVSRDGTAVVGSSVASGGYTEAFRWTAASGLQGLGGLTDPPTSHAYASSADGSVVVGNSAGSLSSLEAFRWTAATGPVALGPLPSWRWSAPAAVSDEGAVVVGTGVILNEAEAFRWTAAGGTQLLEPVPGFANTRAEDVTADGGTIVGFGYGPPDAALRWTDAGVEQLPSLPPRFGEPPDARAVAVSADGRFVVGTSQDKNLRDIAVRWTPWAQPRKLGTLPPWSTSYPSDVSDDGRYVIGHGGAFFWDAVRGIRPLEQMLADEYGLDLTGFSIVEVTGISGDGRILVGSNWVVRLPAQCADGLDNDGNGLVDFPADPSCADADDHVEAPDTDGDWWLDPEDNCPSVANPDQADADENGRGDVCEHLAPVHRVPADFPTIQDAIDGAADGDRIRVDPGLYAENLDFRGKLVAVESRDGPAQTILDGMGAPVVVFESGETQGAALRGFTIRGGLASGLQRGAGVTVRSSAATVAGNVVEDNAGIGVYVHFGFGVRIEGNTIRRNHTGLDLSGDAVVVGNVIRDNLGTGIHSNLETGRIEDNLVASNATSGNGGGLMLRGRDGDISVVQNVFLGNTASSGSEVYWVSASGTLAFVSNVVAQTAPGTTAALWADGTGTPAVFRNNVVLALPIPGNPARFAIHCDDAAVIDPQANLVYAPGGTAWSGCPDPTGTSGNLRVDPELVAPRQGDVRPAPGSPVVDAGDPTTPFLPALDFAGGPRVADGNGDGLALPDMGAFELGPPACANGLDDDGDGWLDHPADPGCASPSSPYEDPLCDNGLDDDGDGAADLADPGCDGAWDVSEWSAALPCDNGVDDDWDALADHPDDPGCFSTTWIREDPECSDWADNDGDGLVDGLDPQCAGRPWDNREAATPPPSCGLGAEILPMLAALAAWRRRRRAGRPR